MIKLFENFINESIQYKNNKPIQRVGHSYVIEYTFKMDKYTYLVNGRFDRVLGDPTSRYVEIDVSTKQKGFDLVESSNPLALITTVKNITKDIINVYLETYSEEPLKYIKMFYVNDNGEGEKNVRSTIFNRSISSALRELNINYNIEKEGKFNSNLFFFYFK